MRALVIGADGFAGRWLLRHLVAAGDEVIAGVGPRFHAALPADLAPHHVDVRDAELVRRVAVTAQPDVVYFLAGVSQAGDREDPVAAIEVSVNGAANTLAALAAIPGRPRLVHIGSAHAYGSAADGRPLSEDTPVRPASVYGAAKAAAEALLLHLGPAVGVDIVAVRPFNHIGPGQDPAFVVPSLAAQVARMSRAGGSGPIRVGNPEARRDFTDVRDVARAYRLLAVHGVDGETYNVASGRAISVREVVTLLLQLAGVAAELEVDPSLLRAADPETVVGDSTKTTRTTGWLPELPLRQTLADVLAEYSALPFAPRSQA